MSDAGRTPPAPWPIDDLTPPPATSRWSFATVTVASTGRISLPSAARDTLEVPTEGRTVSARGRGQGLVLRPDGIGRPMAVDGRGRLTLPVWLRHVTYRTGTVLVAIPTDTPLVLLAPTSLLDAVADAVVGER